MAVSEFAHRQKSRKLLEEINEACDDTPDAMEGELRQAMKAKHRQLLEKEENDVDISLPDTFFESIQTRRKRGSMTHVVQSQFTGLAPILLT